MTVMKSACIVLHVSKGRKAGRPTQQVAKKESVGAG